KIPPQQRIATLEAPPGLRKSLSIVDTFPKPLRRLLPPGLFVWLHYRLTNADAEQAATFFERLASGTNMEQTDPIFLLREKLIQNIASRRKMTDTEQAANAV